MSFDPGGSEGALVNLIGVVIGLGIGLVISAVIAYLLSSCFAVIPAKHRSMEPGMVWLLLIPIFNLYWNFKVYLGLSDSFQSALSAHGEQVGPADTGRTLAKTYCILALVSFIPCLGLIAALVALVFLILFLIKAFELKGRVSKLDTAGDGGWNA